MHTIFLTKLRNYFEQMLLLTVAMHDTVTFSNGVFQRSLFIESKCTLSEIDVNGAR